MVLPRPAAGVEGRPGDVGDQARDRARQHVLGVESLREPDPHVEAAVGHVPVAHGQELLQCRDHGVAPFLVHGPEVHNLLLPVELLQVHGDRELTHR